MGNFIKYHEGYAIELKEGEYTYRIDGRPTTHMSIEPVIKFIDATLERRAEKKLEQELIKRHNDNFIKNGA